MTTYEIQVEKAGEAPLRTIGVLEIKPEGLITRYYPNDPRLPWLAPATEADGMRDRFAKALGNGQAAQVEDLEIHPIRYKPGLHCVFRYDVHTPDGLRSFYAKLFSSDSDQLIKTITALYQARLTVPGMPHVLPPVAYWPELQMIVQPAVTGGIEFTRHVYDTNLDLEAPGGLDAPGRRLPGCPARMRGPRGGPHHGR